MFAGARLAHCRAVRPRSFFEVPFAPPVEAGRLANEPMTVQTGKPIGDRKKSSPQVAPLHAALGGAARRPYQPNGTPRQRESRRVRARQSSDARPTLVGRPSRFVTSRGSGSSCRQAGRVPPGAPQMGNAAPRTARTEGRARPNRQRNFFVTGLVPVGLAPGDLRSAARGTSPVRPPLQRETRPVVSGSVSDTRRTKRDSRTRCAKRAASGGETSRVWAGPVAAVSRGQLSADRSHGRETNTLRWRDVG